METSKLQGCFFTSAHVIPHLESLLKLKRTELCVTIKPESGERDSCGVINGNTFINICWTAEHKQRSSEQYNLSMEDVKQSDGTGNKLFKYAEHGDTAVLPVLNTSWTYLVTLLTSTHSWN